MWASAHLWGREGVRASCPFPKEDSGWTPTSLCCSKRRSASSFSFLYRISISCNLEEKENQEGKRIHGEITELFYKYYYSMFKRSGSHLGHITFVHYLFSISCFISIPCFSRSSLWANVQSTGSEGVSAEGVFSRSARACSGWLKRNTWFLPMMIRFPITKQHKVKKPLFKCIVSWLITSLSLMQKESF